MNKSILNAFLTISLISSTTLSSFAQEEQSEEYNQGQIAQGTLKINRKKLTEDEKIRRDQLLKQSLLLQENYKATIVQIEATQEQLDEAKQKCQDQCTSEDLKGAMSSLNEIATKTASALAVTNTVRLIVGGVVRGGADYTATKEWGANQFSKGIATMAKPWTTMLGVGILTSVAVIGVNKLATDIIAAKDGGMLRNIDNVQKELNKYHAELTTINSQISVINEAMTQVIKIEQRTEVKQKTDVSYDKQ